MDTDPEVTNSTLLEIEQRADARHDLVQLIADVSRQEILGEQIGSVVPRLYTRPLVTGEPGGCYCGCALSRETSYGFDVIQFASEVGKPLDPWQELAAIHIGELLPDGRPRFRIVVIIVARQNGKTEFVGVLCAYWLFMEKQPLVLGTSSNLEYAKEAWQKTVDLAKSVPALSAKLPGTENQGVRTTNGQIQMELAVPTRKGATYPHPRYKIAAANRRGGRSLTINRLVQDEAREQSNWDAWNAAQPATNAVLDAQTFVISNQGDDTAVVLDSLRASALDGDDPRVGILEWSAPEGSRPDDLSAIAAANPNAGRRLSVPSLQADARRAMKKGGKELADFQTEILCMKVRQLNPAVNPVAWADCFDEGDLSMVKGRVALCFDVSIDQLHATLIAAAVLEVHERGDDLVRVEAIEAWDGPGCLNRMALDLPGIVELIRPKIIGWFPDGPAAAVTARISERNSRLRRDGKRTPRWPPRGVKLEPITKDVCAVCMEFADEVTSQTILQAGDELITQHVCTAEKLWMGDQWRFGRRGSGDVRTKTVEVGHVDAAYATAGAVHLARSLPAPRPAAGAA